MTTDELPVLEVQGLSKHFGPVEALSGVDLSVRRGEVLALLGDNGAGKTTLTRCISGMHRATAGTIKVDGREVQIGTPQDARDCGKENRYRCELPVPSFPRPRHGDLLGYTTATA